MSPLASCCCCFPMAGFLHPAGGPWPGVQDLGSPAAWQATRLRPVRSKTSHRSPTPTASMALLWGWWESQVASWPQAPWCRQLFRSSLGCAMRPVNNASRSSGSLTGVVGTIFVRGLINLWNVPVGILVGNVAVLGLPVFTGIAMVKHHLYDIDLLINRTLVYGSLTTMLIALYVGGIVLSQRVFVGLTGQEELPQLAIVAATLMIAALFAPLRRRIQAIINRRFYRRKYDAAKMLSNFNTRLRDEIDLGTLSDDLVGVVKDTMQPEHVTLWLRPDTESKGWQPH